MKKLFNVCKAVGVIALGLYALSSYGYHRAVSGYLAGCKAVLEGQQKAEEENKKAEEE